MSDREKLAREIRRVAALPNVENGAIRFALDAACEAAGMGRKVRLAAIAELEGLGK